MKKLFSILFVLVFTASLVQAQDNAELKKQVQMMNDKMSEMMLSVIRKQSGNIILKM